MLCYYCKFKYLPIQNKSCKTCMNSSNFSVDKKNSKQHRIIRCENGWLL